MGGALKTLSDGSKPPGDGNKVATGGMSPGGGKFFKHANTLAETGNYDYAVEMFVMGLRQEPTNLLQHKALREMAMKRRLAGGKPAGWLEQNRR